MKLKTFMIINAIPALVVGILLVVVPSLLIRALGLTLDKGMDIDGQLYGSELILMGLVCWFARNITLPGGKFLNLRGYLTPISRD